MTVYFFTQSLSNTHNIIMGIGSEELMQMKWRRASVSNRIQLIARRTD